jgi:hypothetical protein
MYHVLLFLTVSFPIFTDFAEGYVKWDDEDSVNRNDWQGLLPDGVYDEDTLQRFCCR